MIFIVPARRMLRWAKASGMEWAMNPAAPAPSEEALAKVPVEDAR
jgi:hypothetical protein